MSKWIQSRLADLTTKIGSGATPLGGEQAYQAEGVALIRSLNVHDGEFKWKDLAFLDQAQAHKLNHVTVESGDVLFNITGASIARCCLVPEGVLPARVNQHVSILRPDPARLFAPFLQYYLISPDCKETLINVGEGAGSTRQALTKAQLQAHIVKFPESMVEQRRIVAILDEAFEGIDTAKVHAEQNLQRVGELFDLALNDAITADAQSVDVTMSEVCEICSKLVDPRDTRYLDEPHVGAGNIVSKTGELIDVLTAREEKLISGKFKFDSSMVLYSKIRPYLMKVVRPDFAGLCSADIYPLAPKQGVITRDFLYYLLRSGTFTAYAIQGSARAGMPKVNRDHLFAYRFKLPSVSIQKNVTARLDELAANAKSLQDIYRHKLTALDELKQSLLHQAFTGQL